MFINDQLHHSTHVTDWLLIIAGLLAFQILSKMPDGIAALQSQHWRAMKRSVKARLPAERLPRVRPPARKQTPPTPLRGRDPAELVVEGITVRFGGVVACDGIGFSVRPGEIVGLIGPNGAGKTTLLDVITGFTTQQAGTVLLDGKPVDRWSAEQRARAGMGRSWQAVELFDEMTVRENLLVAADRKDFRRYMLDIFLPGKPVPTQAMNEVVAEFELEEHLDQRPSDLSQGVARLVGIGRAIVTEPRILLLDEPAAGLDSTESRELGTAIRTVVARTGIGTLIVEHDVNLLLDICDRIVVLDFGRKIAEGPPAEIARDPAVISAYLGVSPDTLDLETASEGVGTNSLS
jgi:sulfate-transporting ATPase